MASSTSSNEQQQLYIGQYFVTWDTAIEYVQKWCNIQGFQTRFNRSERNAEGEYRKLTIICQHAGKSRKPLTELQTNKEKSKKKINKSIQMGCKAHINLSRPERDNINQYVYVTTISNDHCHELNCQLVNYENEVMMSEEMLKDIEFLTKHVHLSTTQQRIYLEEKYPEQKIRSDILRSEIQKYRPSAKDLTTQTTSRVEGLNAVLKKELINSNTSLVQLNKTITRRHQEEERQKEYAFWKSVIPCVIVSQTANFLFPAVETIIKNYLTDPLYNLQVQEINQSVYYRCEQFDLNQFNIFEQEMNTTGFLEDLPDERKACIKSIFNHVNQEEIKENTELPKQSKNQEVPYLTAMIQNNVDKWDQKSKTNLDERIFYGKVMGMAKKVTLKAVENHDTRIFEIFKEYLDENGNLENNDSRNNEPDLNLDV
ncbi:1892_t:CDS:2, partial [Rhizophagus irregularis]